MSPSPLSVPGDDRYNQAQPAAFGVGANDNSLWAQVMAPEAQAQAMSGSAALQRPSLLPVPYQGETGVLQPSFAPMPPGAGFPAIQQTGRDEGGALIPASPGIEEPIYIAPMYTKPRAIIPRYRAISGLISVLIVFGLLCTGAGYYAKATGRLTFLHQLYGDARQKNIKVMPLGTLPIPPTDALQGPAFAVIPSATTASRIEITHGVAVAQDHMNVFKVGQNIYLTYSVHPTSAGVVKFKWYTNSAFYKESKPIPVSNMKEGYTGYIVMQFSTAVEGKVELYWNTLIAITLFFVVEPD